MALLQHPTACFFYVSAVTADEPMSGAGFYSELASRTLFGKSYTGDNEEAPFRDLVYSERRR